MSDAIDTSREHAYQSYLNEVTPSGFSRLDNMIASLGGTEGQQRHLTAQVDMGFQAGWSGRAALDAQAGVTVKPLVWVRNAHSHTYRSTQGGFTVKIGGNRGWEWVRGPIFGFADSRQGAFDAANERHAYEIGCFLEPAPTPLAEVAVRERAAGICDLVVASNLSHRGDALKLAAFDTALDIGNAIRALPTTATHAELLAAALQLPEVKALVDAEREACAQMADDWFENKLDGDLDAAIRARANGGE